MVKVPATYFRIPKSYMRKPPGFKPVNVDDFKSDMQRIGEDTAQEFKDTLIENIETNKYRFTLAKSTIRRKGHDVPLIATQLLIDSIYRDETAVTVEDTPRDDSKLTNLELAIVQEYGTKDKHVPARPVWRNTHRDFRKIARKRFTDFLDDPKFKGKYEGSYNKGPQKKK